MINELVSLVNLPTMVIFALESISPRPNSFTNPREAVQILRLLMYTGNTSFILKMFDFLIRYRCFMVSWQNSTLNFLIVSLYRNFCPCLALNYLLKQRNPHLTNSRFVLHDECQESNFNSNKIKFLLSMMLRVRIMPTEKLLFPIVNSFVARQGLKKQMFQIFGLTVVLGLKIERFH